MKNIEYKCNMCLEVKPKEVLWSMYWKSDVFPQVYVLTKNIDATDKHICYNCINVIKDSVSNENNPNKTT